MCTLPRLRLLHVVVLLLKERVEDVMVVKIEVCRLSGVDERLSRVGLGGWRGELLLEGGYSTHMVWVENLLV